MFLSDSQKQYYAALKKLGKKKPQKLIQRPDNPVLALLYDISGFILLKLLFISI